MKSYGRFQKTWCWLYPLRASADWAQVRLSVGIEDVRDLEQDILQVRHLWQVAHSSVPLAQAFELAQSDVEDIKAYLRGCGVPSTPLPATLPIYEAAPPHHCQPHCQHCHILLINNVFLKAFV